MRTLLCFILFGYSLVIPRAGENWSTIWRGKEGSKTDKLSVQILVAILEILIKGEKYVNLWRNFCADFVDELENSIEN